MDNNGTLFIGKNLIHLKETSSTNEYAINLIAKTNPPQGTCVWADFQTAGRGQIGRSWHSSSQKNILASVILYPDNLLVDQIFGLHVISSLAIVDTLAHFGFAAKIKWPNDIYVNDKKICGILVQNVLRADRVKATVIGIGINVNEDDFPVGLINPVSLFQLTGYLFDRNDVLMVMCKFFEQRFALLSSPNVEDLHDEYQKFLYRLGIFSWFENALLGKFKAQITGVDFFGKLCLKLENGQSCEFNHGEINYIL